MKDDKLIQTLYEALFLATNDLKSIPRDAHGQFGGYASLDQVNAVTKPVLAKYGLFIMHTTTCFAEPKQNVLVTTLIHAPTGQKIESVFVLKPEKDTPQGYGAAITYAKRYAIMGICGLATEDDPDGKMVTNHHAPVSGGFAASKPQYQSNGSASDWVIPFGKFKDKRMGQIAMNELVNYASWIQDAARQKGEGLSKSGQEFILKLQAMQEVSAQRDFAPPEDQIPF